MSNTKPDFSNDPELVECANAMLAAVAEDAGYGIGMESIAPGLQRCYHIQAAAARDFFRERWKPGPTPTPDMSSDPERVALAKVLREAVRSTFRSVSVPNWETMDPEWKREYLFMADAAITHLGSGYRLPEATEANAERLAKAKYAADYPRLHWFFDTSEQQRAVRIADARCFLKVLHAAFSDPAEKPERRTADDWLPRCPVTLDGKRCNLAVHADDVNHDNGETSWLEAQPLQKAQQFEPRKMDATERGERRRERQKLVWEAMMAIGSSYRCTGSTAMGIAITYVDNYLAWRDADTAKDTEAYRCTK